MKGELSSLVDGLCWVCVKGRVYVHGVYLPGCTVRQRGILCEFAFVITEMYFVTAGAAKAEAGLQFAGRL